LKDNITKSEILVKEIRSKPNQYPKKLNSQKKTFSPNNRGFNPFSPLINNVECFICHNYGHVAANCRSRLFQYQANDCFTKTSSASRYLGFFKGYCFACNIFGHKAIGCNRRNMKQKYYDSFSHIRCYACNKFGNVAKVYRNKSMDRLRQHGMKSDKNIDVKIPRKRWINQHFP